MSKTVDERVVSMKFDNSDFERNVKTSMNTLQQFNGSLSELSATKSVGQLFDASSAISGLANVTSSVGNVAVKFSALQAIAFGALENIGKKAEDLAASLVKSLSTDQLVAGWSKYADKTTSVQTIMAATADDFKDTGTQMEYVSEKLEQLNWFTDETSYNFVDMTNNIGKFTSQGIKLENAVTAMEGISVWAAKSGQNAEAASRAMYNLSQALGAGAVKLQDWKSIENANMATKEFKEVAIAAGIANGTIKKGQVTIENFAQSLGDKDTKNWFTSDILMKVLSQYGTFTDKLNEACTELDTTASELLGDLDDYAKGTIDINEKSEEYGVTAERLSSILKELNKDEYELGRSSFKAAQEAKTFGEALDATKDAVSTAWLNIFETIFGNYLEAKELWTDLAEYLYDIFAEPVNKLGHLLKQWSKEEVGGRSDLIQSFYNIADTLQIIGENISEAWHAIFPEWTVKNLTDIVTKFKKFTESTKPTVRELYKFRTILEGAFAFLSLLKKALIGCWESLEPFRKGLGDVGTKVVNFAVSVSKGLIELNDGLISFDGFKEFAKQVNEYIFAKFPKIKEHIDNAKNAFVDFGNKVKKAMTDAKSAIIGFGKQDSIFNKAIDLKPAKEGFVGAIDTIKAKLSELKNRIKNEGIVSVLKEMASKLSEYFGIIKTKFLSFIETIKSKMPETEGYADKFKSVLVKLEPIGDGLIKLFSSILNCFTSFFDGLAKEFKIAPLVTLKNLLSSIFSMELIKGIKEFMSSLNEDVEGPGKLFKSISSFFDGFTSNGKTITKSINETFGSLKNSLKSLTKLVDAGIIRNLAISIAILAASIFALSLVDCGNLAVATGSVSALLWELVSAMKSLNKMGINNRNPFNGISSLIALLLTLSIALGILASALVKIGSLGMEGMEVGLVGISACLWELIAVLKVLDKLDIDIEQANQLAVLALALSISAGLLATAIKKLGGLTWQEALQGIIGVAAIMAVLVFLCNKIRADADALKSAATIFVVAIAIGKLVESVELLATIPYEQMGQGIVAIAFLMAMLIGMIAVISQMSTADKQILKSAITLAAITLAVVELAKVIQQLGQMGTGELIQGFVAVAALMTALWFMLENIPQSAIKAALSFILLAASLYIMTKAIEQLVGIKWEDIQGGIIGLAAALGVITALSYIMGKNATTFTAGTAIIGGLSATLYTFAVAMKKFEGISWDGIKGGILGFGICVALLTAASYLLGTNAAIMAVGAVVLIVLAAALAIFAVSLNLLKDIDLQSIGDGLVGLGIALLVLMAFTAVLGSAAPVFGIGVLILLAMAAAMLIFAAAIYVFGASLGLISQYGITASESIGILGEALAAHLDTYLKGSYVLATFAVAALALSVACLAAGAGLIVFSVGLVAAAVAMAVFILITNLLAQFTSGLITCAIAIATFVNIIASVAVQAAIVSAVLLALAVTMDLFSVSCGLLVLGIGALTISLALLAGSFELLGLALGTCADSLSEIVDSIDKLSKCGKPASEAIKEFAKGLALAVPSLKQSAKDLSPLSKYIKEIADPINKLSTNLNLVVTNLLSVNNNIPILLNNILLLTTALLTINNTMVLLNNGIKANTNQILTTFTLFFASLSQSIKNNEVILSSNAKSLGNNIVESIKSTLSAERTGTIGRNLSVGLANGIRNNQKSAINAATEVGNNVKKAMQKALEVHSPSRFGIWLGEMVDEGLNSGLKDNAETIYQTSNEIGTNAIESMQDAIGKVSNTLALNIDNEPIIRPVVDMSEVENKASKLDTLFDQNRVSNISADFNANRLSEIKMKEDQINRTNQIGYQLADALGNMSEASDQPINIQVVLEGDADGVFNLVRTVNTRYLKTSGYSPLRGY